MRFYIISALALVSHGVTAQELTETGGLSFDFSVLGKDGLYIGTDVSLDRYSWLDAVKIAAISTFDPSILTETRLVSGVNVMELPSGQSDSDLWEKILTSSTFDPAADGFSSTGYAVAIPSSGETYTLNDLRCSLAVCLIAAGEQLNSLTDLPSDAIVISPDRNEFNDLGGFTILVKPTNLQ